jgi:hypothetical protein
MDADAGLANAADATKANAAPAIALPTSTTPNPERLPSGHLPASARASLARVF